MNDKFYYNITRILLSVIFLIITSCSTGTEVEINKSSLSSISLELGITNQEIDMGKSGTLSFTLSVPKITEGEEVPFVIALHWAGIYTPHFAEEYLRGLAEPGLHSLDAIIFAPDVPGDSWNNDLSENVILEFIKAAKDAWPINPNKIIITGYSMGGNGTWFLIDRHPNIFSACIPMASVPSGNLSGKVPTYIIHGNKDELFDYKNAENAYKILKDNGAKVKISIADNLSHYQGFRYVPFLRLAAKWIKDDIW